MADLVIRNALLVDGSGTAPRHADVATEGDRIVEVGQVATRAPGRSTPTD